MDRARFDPSKMKSFAAEYSSSDEDGEDDDDLLMPSTDPTANEFADFNPRKRRRTGRDAKESAALGIFGSESEDERPGQRWKRKTLRNKGVSFVSQGKKASDSEELEDGNDGEQGDGNEHERDEPSEPGTMKAHVADEDEDEEDEDDEDMGGVGLGFGAPSGGIGLGWAPPTRQQMPPHLASTPSKPAMKTRYDVATPLGQAFTPSSANDPVLKVRDEPTPTPQISRPSAFSGAKAGKSGKPKINAGSFGARMMAKRGYVEGQGLGKEGQGRNVIIEANLRTQNIGLGAVKEKTEQERQP
jgi:tuftelin-interacting protein 11